MCPVIYQSCYIIFRHLWELFLEYAFEPCEDDDAVTAVVIVDDAELNFALSLLNHCRLYKLCEVLKAIRQGKLYLLREWDDGNGLPLPLWRGRVGVLYPLPPNRILWLVACFSLAICNGKPCTTERSGDLPTFCNHGSHDGCLWMRALVSLTNRFLDHNTRLEPGGKGTKSSSEGLKKNAE